MAGVPSPQSPSFFLGFLAPLPRLRRPRRPVSTIKPHRTIGSQTLARWIKTALQLAGLDIDMFKPHSTRHAASTAAYQASFPLEEIFKGRVGAMLTLSNDSTTSM